MLLTPLLLLLFVAEGSYWCPSLVPNLPDSITEDMVRVKYDEEARMASQPYDVEVICKPGYDDVGSQDGLYQCMPSGNYGMLILPICVPKTCSPLTVSMIVGADPNVECSTKFGEICEVPCNEPNFMGRSGFYRCLIDEFGVPIWKVNYQHPECFSNCGPTIQSLGQSGLNGLSYTCSATTHGSMCNVYCLQGYHGSPSAYQCGSNFQWEPLTDAATCTKAKCEVPQGDFNGVLDFSDPSGSEFGKLEQGSSLILHCDDGYSFEGQKTIRTNWYCDTPINSQTESETSWRNDVGESSFPVCVADEPQQCVNHGEECEHDDDVCCDEDSFCFWDASHFQVLQKCLTCDECDPEVSNQCANLCSITTTNSPSKNPSLAPSSIPTKQEECNYEEFQHLKQANDVMQDELDRLQNPLEPVTLAQPIDTIEEGLETWMFEQVDEKVSPHLPQGHVLTLSMFDGFVQYAVKDILENKLYSTCVFFHEDSDVPCPSNAQCGATTSNGWPNAVAKRLKEAFRRNNFRHEYCHNMRQVCEYWPIWWKETFLEKSDFSFNQLSKERVEEMSHNVCVSPNNELMYVQKDGLYHTCVGTGPSKQPCPTDRRFMCVGMSLGQSTYGYPGQILQVLTVALNHGEEGTTDYFHPQCGIHQNRN